MPTLWVSAAPRADGPCNPTPRQCDRPGRADTGSRSYLRSDRRSAPDIPPLQICNHKSVALDGHTGLDRNGPREHRAVVRERVELAALAAGIGAGGQVREQCGVEFTAGKCAIELSRIDTGDPGAEAGADHRARARGA